MRKAILEDCGRRSQISRFFFEKGVFETFSSVTVLEYMNGKFLALPVA
ncbi:hypothetical protein LINPERPRIM_LOCUS17280 [Linum perenne]